MTLESLFETTAVFLVGLLARLALLVLVALVITAPIVAAIWLGRRLGALRRKALRLERADGLAFRDGLDYTPGHVWLRPERRGRLRLGLDDVARQLFPEGVRLGLPAVGRFLKAGEPLAELDWQGVHAALPSPVAGTVIRVNQAAVRRPGRALEEPYTRGWLVQLQPSNGRAKEATHGDAARGWLRAEAARLGHFVEDELGFAAADGGELRVSALQALGPERWQKLVEVFLNASVETERA
jgi:glycine cleavage system H lipoate-binding protein